MRGISCLNKHQVERSATTVVNDFNVDYPPDFYQLFKDIGRHYLQFTPIVERIPTYPDGRHLAPVADDAQAELADFSVTPKQWGHFPCTVFNQWVHNDVGSTFVQLFDTILANWMGMNGSSCIMARECGHAGAMECNGDVYSCDHFVSPEYKLGNIRDNTLTEMMYCERQQVFGQNKYRFLPQQCKNCHYLFACHGECPKNRSSEMTQGEPGLNYLCQGYYCFFKHVAPYMDFMKHELTAHRLPSNVMDATRNGLLQEHMVSHHPFAATLWQKTVHRFLFSCEGGYLCVGCFANHLNLYLDAFTLSINAVDEWLLIVGFKQMA